MFIFYIEHFLSDIRSPQYFHLKKVYFFVGHPVRKCQISLDSKIKSDGKNERLNMLFRLDTPAGVLLTHLLNKIKSSYLNSSAITFFQPSNF